MNMVNDTNYYLVDLYNAYITKDGIPLDWFIDFCTDEQRGLITDKDF